MAGVQFLTEVGMSYLMARLWVDKGLLEIAKDNYQRLGLLLDVRGYQGHLIQLW